MTFGSEDACVAGDEVRGEGGGRGQGQASLLLVEMADPRPGARQGSQSSLSKSCVALPHCLECLEEGEREGER